jgi:predicted amino acid dehydrogenase
MLESLSQETTNQHLGTFAFLAHPTDKDSIHRAISDAFPLFDIPKIQSFVDFAQKTKLGNFEVASISHVPKISSDQGGYVDGYIIFSPYTAEEMFRLKQKDKKILIKNYIDKAISLNANIIGLGAFTSVITKGGQTCINDQCLFTTGSSLTALSAFEAVMSKITEKGKKINDINVGVVGAGGAIGKLVSKLFFEKAAQLTLIGNPKSPSSNKSIYNLIEQMVSTAVSSNTKDNFSSSEKIKSLFYDNNYSQDDISKFVEDHFKHTSSLDIAENPPLKFTTDINEVCSKLDVIICATSDTGTLILPENCKDDAILCDLARPSNIPVDNNDISSKRSVFEGGLIQFPHPVTFGTQNILWFPPEYNLACLAETIVLTMEKVTRNYSIGMDIDVEEARWVSQKSKEHGFSVYLEN